MTPCEMEHILKNKITLIYDTREKENQSLGKRIKEIGFKSKREKLDFGDYSAEFEKDGEVISLADKLVIERKMSIDEICGNFTKGRKRFANEFERAREKKAKVHLIIENGSYEKIIKGKYRSQLNSNSLYSSLIAFCDRYNLTIHFCKAETTPSLIKKIIYHHVRNLLSQEIKVGDEIDDSKDHC